MHIFASFCFQHSSFSFLCYCFSSVLRSKGKYFSISPVGGYCPAHLSLGFISCPYTESIKMYVPASAIGWCPQGIILSHSIQTSQSFLTSEVSLCPYDLLTYLLNILFVCLFAVALPHWKFCYKYLVCHES